MATRTTTRRISRREAVELLGATAVIGAARPAPVSAGQKEKQKDPNDPCEKKAVVETYTGSNGQAIVSYSCCPETRTAILVGVEEPNETPTRRTKDHLKPLRDRLDVDKLAEWCLMIWGLDEKQLQTLLKLVPGQVDIRRDDRK